MDVATVFACRVAVIVDRRWNFNSVKALMVNSETVEKKNTQAKLLREVVLNELIL